MTQLSGRRVLVTGASGLVAFPVAVELAKSNEVYAVARFSNPEQKRKLEAAGVRPIAFDLAEQDLSPLPRSVDVVINYAVLGLMDKEIYNVNAGAAGRLARRYRDCEAFVHGSTGSLYQYQGERPLREDDAYGLHSSAEPYAASKIAAEFLLRHLCEDYRMPTVMVRIFSFYGPRGGGVTQRVDQVAQGRPVSVYPGARNIHTPLYEDDYVEKTIAAAGIAKTPAEIVNLGGTEAVTTQEYCEMAGELLGKKPIFVENSRAWPIWADTSKMVKLLGPCKVSMREGVRRVVESGLKARVGQHHVVGEPAAAQPQSAAAGVRRPSGRSAVRQGCAPMNVDELLARESIRKTMVDYNIAGDRLKTDEFVAVFTEDGIIETEVVAEADRFRYQGREAIRAWMNRWRKPAGEAPAHATRFIRHHLSTCQIELTGPDTAKTRTYWIAYTSLGPDHCGYYLDEFRKVGDDWLIAHRRIREDWRRADSLYNNAVAHTRG